MRSPRKCRAWPKRKYKEPCEGEFQDFEKHLIQHKNEFQNKVSEQLPSNIEKRNVCFFGLLHEGTIAFYVIAKHKITNKYYTVEVIKKKHAVVNKRIRSLKNYKQIAQTIRFPFVLHLELWFQDFKNIYFVFPFITHIDLFLLMQKVQTLQERDAKFYGAQILLALEYLHSIDIVYRNIKPENIIFDTFGYIKLCSFKYAKICPLRTYSFCGTPEYLSPELILQKGYGKWVDFWSYGVLLYEMIAGHTPFYSQDEMKLFENIVETDVRFYPHFSAQAKDLIRNILQRDLSLRYGVLRQGIYDIKCHEWFEIIDWQSLYSKSIHPPFHPERDISPVINTLQREVIFDKTATNEYDKAFENF